MDVSSASHWSSRRATLGKCLRAHLLAASPGSNPARAPLIALLGPRLADRTAAPDAACLRHSDHGNRAWRLDQPDVRRQRCCERSMPMRVARAGRAGSRALATPQAGYAGWTVVLSRVVHHRHKARNLRSKSREVANQNEDRLIHAMPRCCGRWSRRLAEAHRPERNATIAWRRSRRGASGDLRQRRGRNGDASSRAQQIRIRMASSGAVSPRVLALSRRCPRRSAPRGRRAPARRHRVYRRGCRACRPSPRSTAPSSVVTAPAAIATARAATRSALVTTAPGSLRAARLPSARYRDRETLRRRLAARRSRRRR